MSRVQIISHGHANDVRVLVGDSELLKAKICKIEILIRPEEMNRAVITFEDVSVNVEAEAELP